MDYFSNICRICMSKDIELISIYHTDEDMITFVDKLNTCVPDIFTTDHYLPYADQICELCCKNLKKVFWFRELCLKSNELLKAYKLNLNEEMLRNDIQNKPESIKICDTTKETYDNETKNISEEHNNTNKNTKFLIDNSRTEINSRNFLSIKIKSESSENEYSNDNEILKCTSKVVEQMNSDKTNESISPKSPESVNLKLSTNIKIVQHDNEQTSKRHVCSFCEKSFKYRQGMQIHERIHTGYKPYKCSLCPKAFAKNTSLKIHMNTHTKEKQFTCTVCGKKFNQNSNLKIHMKLHVQTERFACHLCEKTFSQKRHLKQHILFHQDEKRFSCEVCNSNFSMKQHLKRHMLIHTEEGSPKIVLPKNRERKFPCTMCEWSFMSKSVMQNHLKIHENGKIHRTNMTDPKRRFPCTLCVWSFTKKQHLERHMVKHKDNRKFSCAKCSEEFGNNYELQKHLKFAHNESC